MQYKRKRAGLLKSALLGAATLGAISLAGAGVAQAGQIDFNFGLNTLTPTQSSNGPCSGVGGTTCHTYSSPATYTTGGISLNATAFYNPNYGTSGSATFNQTHVTQTTANSTPISSGVAGEVGLGVQSPLASGGSSREIDPGEYLVLDMSKFMGGAYSLTSIKLGSIQSGEGGSINIYSSAADSLSNLSLVKQLENTGSSNSSQTYDFASGYTANYLIITADNPSSKAGNIVVSDLVVNTPEPGSLALLGTGLLGLGLVARRRRRKVA